MKPTVYLETTIISYLGARPSRDLVIAAHQQVTREWWDQAREGFEVFISPIVLDEISRGDEVAAGVRQNLVASFPLLEVRPEVAKLAETYFAKFDLPEKARADAFHLALATWHGMDYLLSWNCTHIASGRVKRWIEEINSATGIRTPVICTPEELMEA